jgi:hypothetical protein
MMPEQFIDKWSRADRAERQAAQEHFIDLCRVLDEPTPNEADDADAYSFEKGYRRQTARAASPMSGFPERIITRVTRVPQGQLQGRYAPDAVGGRPPLSQSAALFRLQEFRF